MSLGYFARTILFADDTTIYKTGKQINNIYEDMNNKLQVLADWFRANKLSLYISKTKSMLFCRYPPRQNEELILTMSNTIIQVFILMKNLIGTSTSTNANIN